MESFSAALETSGICTSKVTVKAVQHANIFSWFSPYPGFFTVLGTKVRPTTAAIMMAGRIHVQSGEMFSGTARPATTGLSIIRPISEPATTAAR